MYLSSLAPLSHSHACITMIYCVVYCCFLHIQWDIDRARDETTEGVGWTNSETLCILYCVHFIHSLNVEDKYANHIAIGMAQHKSNHSRMQV